MTSLPLTPTFAPRWKRGFIRKRNIMYVEPLVLEMLQVKNRCRNLSRIVNPPEWCGKCRDFSHGPGLLSFL